MMVLKTLKFEPRKSSFLRSLILFNYLFIFKFMNYG